MADSTHGAVYNFIPEHEAAWHQHRKVFKGTAFFWTQSAHSRNQPHGWIRLQIRLTNNSAPNKPDVTLTGIDPEYSGPMNKTVILRAATDYIQRLIVSQGCTKFPTARQMSDDPEGGYVAAHVPHTPFKF